jgi:hypothetical protein
MANNTLWSVFRARDQVSGTVGKMNRSVTGFSRNAQRSFRGIGSSISRMRGLISGAAIALTTGVAARAVSDFAKSGDEIAKTSRKIGLSAEALQELRFAADRSGVSSEAFTTALEKMNKNIGDLRANTGALYTYLGKTDQGFMKTLQGAQSNEEAFNLLVQRISEIENPMDRAALAQAAFGRAGQDLIVMAENGSAGIEQLREEARKYGDIISTDAANSSEKFVDAMTNLKASINGVKNNALVPFLSTIGGYIQRAADWAAANKELINEKLSSFFGTINSIGKTIQRNWQSGLIPAVLAAAGAFKVVTLILTGAEGLVAAIELVKAAMAAGGAAGWLSGGPIALIAAAVAAVIFLVVLLVKHWDKVKAAVVNFATTAWNWLMKILDNPLFKVLGVIFLPFITIPLLIIKHWDKVKAFFGNVWEGLKAGAMNVGGFFKKAFLTAADIILTIYGNIVKVILGVISKVGKALGFEMAGLDTAIQKISDAQEKVRSESAIGDVQGLISANQGVQESRTTTENRSTVDVNFNNTPQGTTVRQRGRAPGLELNTGYGGVR